MEKIITDCNGKLTIIPDGYVLCPRCNGVGYHPDYDQAYNGTYAACWLCEGTSCIDWILYASCQDWEMQDIMDDEEWNEDCEKQEHFQELRDRNKSSFVFD